ncbi:MFS transporter [Rhodococcus sp. H29-C3]|uniref:MFS transporter n=1 Tax=Rhodococcus sp. H29-C3 TaxID=3046307 RepID=UPI0024BA893A|nr:MFS transporter [Rhodococcus sp. H29-C3]MDJ0363182.1 MFS transporter [Rhodococcus sp. H29-C3]
MSDTFLTNDFRIAGAARTTALVVILLASFMDLLDVTILNVTAPSIERDLGASPSQLQWLLAGYTLAFAIGLITGARLGDLVGYKRMFLLGVAGFTVASAVCGMAPTPVVLITARVVQGLFAAALIPQVLSQIQVMYAPHERGGAMAAFSALSGLAASIGPILGGILIEADLWGLGWRLVFWINVPVGLAALVIGAKTLPESRSPSRPRLDLIGVGLSALGLLLVVYPLIEVSGTRPWPVWTYWSMAAGVLVLIGFTCWQRLLAGRGGEPLLELSLFRIRSLRGGLLVQLLFFIPIMGFFLIFMQLLQLGIGMSPIRAGLTLLPWSIATTVTAILGAAVLVPKIGRLTVQIGLLLLALGFGLLAFVADSATTQTGWLALLPGVLVGGAGMGFAVAPLAQLTLGEIPAAHASSGSGLFNTVAQLAASIGVAAIGTLFFSRLSSTSEQRSGTGGFGQAFSTSMWVGIVMVGVALAASFLLPRTVDYTSPVTDTPKQE